MGFCIGHHSYGLRHILHILALGSLEFGHSQTQRRAPSNRLGGSLLLASPSCDSALDSFGAPGTWLESCEDALHVSFSPSPGE